MKFAFLKYITLKYITLIPSRSLESSTTGGIFNTLFNRKKIQKVKFVLKNCVKKIRAQNSKKYCVKKY